jgi:EAL domain-containing protein (putative c-di-GMP-specific phosphodiesterase class I)
LLDGCLRQSADAIQGNRMPVRLIVEGVETRDVAWRWFVEGCRLMQGWLFAPASPVDSIDPKGGFTEPLWRP